MNDTLTEKQYCIGRGETLSSISKKYGVPINSIVTLNRDVVDVDLVYEGQHLGIPALYGCSQRVCTHHDAVSYCFPLPLSSIIFNMTSFSLHLYLVNLPSAPCYVIICRHILFELQFPVLVSLFIIPVSSVKSVTLKMKIL